MLLQKKNFLVSLSGKTLADALWHPALCRSGHSCKLSHLHVIVMGIRALSYGNCLCVSALSHHSRGIHKVRLKVSSGPACPNWRDPISSSHKLLVWLLRLNTEEREGLKWEMDWETKSSFWSLSVQFEVRQESTVMAQSYPDECDGGKDLF